MNSYINTSKIYCHYCGRELQIYSFVFINTGKTEKGDITYKTCACVCKSTAEKEEYEKLKAK